MNWDGQVAAELRADEVGLNGPRLDLALHLWRFYNESGVANGAEAQALYLICPRCDDCWREAQDRQPPPKESGVSLPWIGERYLETRICVVAENLVGYGGMTAHYEIGHHKFDSLERNERKGDGSFMGWATAAYVDAIRRSQRGERPMTTLPEPSEVANGYADCAFLEAVKCSPSGDRSSPTAAMRNNCPDLLLEGELRLLKPSVLVLHGNDARGAVEWVVDGKIPMPKPFERTTIEFDGRSIETFAMTHPAARGAQWKAAYAHLAASLIDQEVS